MESTEKRKSIRYPCTYHINYLVMGEPAKTREGRAATEGEVMDLSSRGARIREGQLLKEGSLVQVMLPVDGKPVMVPVISEVRWVKEEMPGKFQTGLKFLL